MPKAQGLVCQYLENISRKVLRRFQSVIRLYVRGRQGIYALHHGDELYYVGLASDLHVRLKQHLEDRHGGSWDRFSVYLTLSDDHLRELECLVLRIVKPTGNRVKGNFRRADNLRRRLAHDIRALHKHELNELMGRKEKIAEPALARKQSGRTPVMQRYIAGPMKIQAKYKGKLYRAHVRSDGSIRFNGATFTSPSVAGSSLAKHAIDGWIFWKYERAPGDWVLLNELRKHHAFNANRMNSAQKAWNTRRARAAAAGQ